MKKRLLILMLISLLLLLCACGTTKKTDEPEPTDTSSTVEEDISNKSEENKTSDTPQPTAADTSEPTDTDMPQPTVTPTPSPCQHNYKSEVTKEATCTSTGLMEYACSKCGDSYTETIQKEEHSSVIDRAVEATCEHTGLTEGSHCSVCGSVLTAQKETAKKQHVRSVGTTVKATCTENGYTIYICSVCGQELARESIPATGHSFENGVCKKCGFPDPNYLPISTGGDYELPEDEL